MSKPLPKLDPDYVLVDESRIHEYKRTMVEPPYTLEELTRINRFSFLWYKFLQENNLTTRKLVEIPEDVEKVVLKAKDLTTEGLLFYRDASRFLDLRDFNVNPENRVKRILEKELGKIRKE